MLCPALADAAKQLALPCRRPAGSAGAGSRSGRKDRSVSARPAVRAGTRQTLTQ